MNNLPVESKENNIFKKLFKFISNIFKRQKNEEIETIKEQNTLNKITELYKVENLDEINASIINQNEKQRKIEEIINIIEKEPDILERLDIPKLEIIDQYYKNKVEEYKKKLVNM